MGVNIVNYGNNTLIDLSSDTITPDKMLAGTTAHDASGESIVGTGEMKLLRDSLIIPDKYNTGCRGRLTKFNIATDTSGIIWRDGSTNIDFTNGKGIQNLNANQVVVFKDYDFTDYTHLYFLNVQNYFSTSTYYRDGVRIVFINCLFNGVRQDYNFDSNVNISIEFYNCSSNRMKVGNAIIDRCLLGNATYYQTKDPAYVFDGDAVTPKGALNITNSYIMDVEPKTETQGQGHIDGLQVLADPSGHDVHIFNCRFECFDMPYPASTGNWSYSLFWQGDTTNSSVEHCIIHGGGYYGVNIRKANNQYLANNLISGEYHCSEGAPETDWVRACYPDSNAYQMSDGWADYIRTLLVSSVWVEDEKIKICYSNDMHSIRTMRIVTDDNRTFTVSVPACPLRDTAASEGVTKWDDLPFDLVTEIDMAGVHSVSIYDGSTLVRTFVVDASGDDVPDIKLGVKTITQNGIYSAADDDLDGYSEVTVNVTSPVSGTINIAQNGTYDVSQYANADVNVQPNIPYLDIREYTPATNVNSFTLQYPTGKELIGVYVYDVNRDDRSTYTMTMVSWYKFRGDNASSGKSGAVLNYQGNEAFSVSYGSVTVSDGTVTIASHNNSYYFRSNRIYRVLLIYQPS